MKKMLIALALFSSLSACSLMDSVMFWKKDKIPLNRITVSAEAGANRGSASMLDIVFVYDQAIVAQLPKTGPDWFRQKDALLKMFATSVDVVSLQVPAVTPAFDVKFPERASKAVGVFVLANYASVDGQPIASLTLWQEAKIRLMPDTIEYSGKLK